MSVEQWSDLLFSEAGPRDGHAYGSVRAVNEDGSYMVQLNASSTLTRCAPFCTAMVGDRVKVVINANGKCDAIGRLGGEVGGGGTVDPAIEQRFEGIESDILDMRTNKVLATTASFMNESQTITLSEAISEQASGIVLAWSGYYSGNAQDYDWIFTFVPKHHVKAHNGAGVCCYGLCSDGQMMKYVYVSDTTIEGHSSATDTGTYGGVTRANNKYVLRYVLGV